MRSVIKNSWLVFKRNKDYFAVIIVAPIIMLIIATIFIAFDSKSTVAYVKTGSSALDSAIEDTFSHSDAFGYKVIDEDEIASELVSGNADVVIAGGNGAGGGLVMYTAKEDTDFQRAVSLLIKKAQLSAEGDAKEVKLSVNKAPFKTAPISNSLGMTLFKIITGGALLTIILLENRYRGISQRILLSGIPVSQYLTGMSVVFFISSVVSSLVYFLAAEIGRLDMGLPNDLLIIPVLITSNIFAVSIGLFLAAFRIKPDQSILISSGVIMLMAIVSGGILPYDKMPSVLRHIADFMPLRWMLKALEIMQCGGSFASASVYLVYTVIFCAVLYIAGVIGVKKLEHA